MAILNFGKARAMIAKRHLFWLLFLGKSAFLAIAIVRDQFYSPPRRPAVYRALSDLRSLRTAMEAYAVDNQAYPRSVSMKESSTYSQQPTNASDYQLPNGRSPQFFPRELTTPIAYHSSNWTDRFGGEKARQYLYYMKDNTYVIISAGPDLDYDADPEDYFSGNYDALHLAGYDPTNGAKSSGDVIVSHRRSEPY